MKQRISTWFIATSVCCVCCVMSGCAAVPVPATATGAAATAAEPMTLPRYLGVTTVMRSAHTTIYRSRLRLARHIPILEPAPAAVPMALGDPAAMQSPAPAMAAAASIQQAEASAPGKIAALNYLARVDCAQHPQVEEALLASLCDPIDSVRIAALQALLSGQQRCGHVCNSCGPSCSGGCCTPAIHARLVAIASEQTDQGCACEPNATARRLARLALANCHPVIQPQALHPEEVPAPEILQSIGL